MWQREGKDRKCEKEVRDMGDRTRSKMHVDGEPERDVMAKVIFEEIMAEKFLELIKDNNPRF